MGQSLANILVHLVFATKGRRRLIVPELQESLYEYIGGICRSRKVKVHQIGGIEDHIHMLISLPRDIALSRLVNEVKAISTKWVRGHGGQWNIFGWQGGYGAFSIGQSMYNTVIDYIANQKRHHQTMSFKEEMEGLLRKYQVEFDPHFLWQD
jgi:putative transposase